MIDGHQCSSCLRLRRQLAGDGEYTRSCGRSTLPSRIERNSSGDSSRSAENGEDVEGLVCFAVGKLQNLLDCADAERVLDESEVHLVAQGLHVGVVVHHGDEQVEETAFFDCIEVIWSASQSQ